MLFLENNGFSVEGVSTVARALRANKTVETVTVTPVELNLKALRGDDDTRFA